MTPGMVILLVVIAVWVAVFYLARRFGKLQEPDE